MIGRDVRGGAQEIDRDAGDGFATLTGDERMTEFVREDRREQKQREQRADCDSLLGRRCRRDRRQVSERDDIRYRPKDEQRRVVRSRFDAEDRAEPDGVVVHDATSCMANFSARAGASSTAVLAAPNNAVTVSARQSFA